MGSVQVLQICHNCTANSQVIWIQNEKQQEKEQQCTVLEQHHWLTALPEVEAKELLNPLSDF